MEDICYLFIYFFIVMINFIYNYYRIINAVFILLFVFVFSEGWKVENDNWDWNVS